MTAKDMAALIDRIYEAAVLPELWSDVCAELSIVGEGYSTCLITIGQDGNMRWISTPNVEEIFERYSTSEMRFQNVRPGRAIDAGPMMFMRDLDLMTMEEIAADPLYETFMRPAGLGWSMGAVSNEPSGHMLIYDMMRKTGDGPFLPADVDRLNAIKGDLARAALISSRMAFRQVQSIAETLAMIGLAAAVIGADQRVIAVNADMEALAPRVRTGAGDRISLAHGGAENLLLDALHRLQAGAVPTVQSIPVFAEEGAPALILHLLPVRRHARDIFTQGVAVVIASEVGPVGPPDVRVLAGLFDMTPGEARVAREIASGATLESAAMHLNLSVETIRTYLKRIFAKTGTRRQPELVRLLSGLGNLPV